ncbi:hypothetical protein [Thermomonospora umbrina]|uniref:VWA domain-containing protein n=1 Tax=Thermomonospora umbrina TaxID=111806 RepID=A0A3D9SFQ1_9ACTN|nr:hypothetical protein [Thermomonospora umbrina]REE94736.1 hypothetical protein DFJ69_0086 [Thermomonospora umbrina]
MSRPRLLPAKLLPSRLLGGNPPGSPRPVVAAGVQLGHAGRPSSRPTLTIALFDNSGSVVAPSGTDPASQRFAEVERAFELVARSGTSGELAAVLHFDSPCSGDVLPVPLTRRGLEQLRSGLRLPPDGAGSSVLAPSLARAVALAQTHPDHAATLVLLSDFQLLDSDPLAVLASLAAFPGQVHAVVLDHQIDTALFPPGVTISRIGDRAQPGAVARALFASLVAHRPGSWVRPEP